MKSVKDKLKIGCLVIDKDPSFSNYCIIGIVTSIDEFDVFGIFWFDVKEIFYYNFEDIFWFIDTSGEDNYGWQIIC